MNLGDDEFKYKSRVFEIAPNTKRNQELRAKKLAEENQRKQEAEKMKKVAEEQAMRREQLLMEKEKLRKIEEDKRKEDLRRQQEELQEINTLKGKFGSMINELKTDATSLEFTITGLNLLPAQIRILVQATMVNQSLRSLSMIRKAINDHDGVEIAKCMNGNQSLESLILEGNQLGPLSAEAIGNLIERNNTLRVIDLEGNDLTDGGKNSNGIYVLANALKYNKSLLCLNLTNTNLDAECGKVLLEAMKDNKTCIMLDITQNTKMGLNDVREIQKILEKNKLAYDEERFKEFMERKCLKREEDISKILQLKQETKEMIREGIDKRIEAKQLQIDLEWKKKLEDDEILRQKEIIKLDKLSKARIAAKKKKRRGPSKKK